MLRLAIESPRLIETGSPFDLSLRCVARGPVWCSRTVVAAQHEISSRENAGERRIRVTVLFRNYSPHHSLVLKRPQAASSATRGLRAFTTKQSLPPVDLAITPILRGGRF